MRTIRTITQVFTGSLESSHTDPRGVSHSQYPLNDVDEVSILVSLQSTDVMDLYVETSWDHIDKSASDTENDVRWVKFNKWNSATSPETMNVTGYRFDGADPDKTSGVITIPVTGNKMRIKLIGNIGDAAEIVMFTRKTFTQ